VRIGENHRAQLRFGDGAVIVGDVRGDRHPPRRGEVTSSVMVRVEDVHAHCERARQSGARILTESRPTSSTANGSTPPRTLRAISGRSPKRSPTLHPRNGAGNPSIPIDRSVRAEPSLSMGKCSTRASTDDPRPHRQRWLSMGPRKPCRRARLAWSRSTAICRDGPTRRPSMLARSGPGRVNSLLIGGGPAVCGRGQGSVRFANANAATAL
jgi:hypothetical protein